MHICTSDISLGVLLLTQLKRLAREGYEVIGVSSPGPFAQRLRDAGIQFFPVPMVRAIDPLGDLKALAGLYRTLRRLRPAIVHTHTPKAGLLGQYAALMARVPARVHTIHGLYLPGHMTARTRPLYLALERETMRFPHLVLSQNPEDVTTAAAEKICAPERIRYLGNGIDLGYFNPAEVSPAAAGSVRQELGIAPGDRVVGIVARVNEEKGFREFFQAAATLAASFPTAKFLVIGPIEREKFDALDPHELAAAAGVADRLIYAGLRDDMRELYSVMDVLVLPSHREGFPRAPMEASAMGRPVVATNIRGCRQVVRDGETGFLVPLRDPAALAAAIGRLLADKELAARMGRAARALALAEFDENVVFERTIAAYRDLLADRRL